MNLFIIEGAGKIKKISSIIGKDYKIIATLGHIQKLKNNSYDNTGITKELDFNFEFIDGKNRLVNKINSNGKKAENIYIATDPDREGEGIAWSIYNNLTIQNKLKSKRITFNEISSTAIKEALKNPRQIDQNYVDAYLARLALDKKIGFGLSDFLQKNNDELRSAGRVQSVVLKLIIEREQEINNFVPKTTYYVCPKINNVELLHKETTNDLSLFTNHQEKKFSFLTLDECNNYIQNYLSNDFHLIKINEGETKIVYPSEPFKTSTLQPFLIKELKIKSKKAEELLQKLYEKGLITYPRTDATRMSELFCNEALKFVYQNYPNLASNEFHFNKTKSSSGEQNAHEAIRVVHLDEFGDEIEEELEKRAYEIIYQKTLIQFLKPMIKEITTFEFKNKNDIFIAKSEVIIQQGFYEYLDSLKQDKILNFELNKIYHPEQDMIRSSTTTCPKLFTQATLIKELEKLKIGRPSTYAGSVEINNIRKYTLSDNKENLTSTLRGQQAYSLLTNTWSELINFNFTAQMEEKLDEIADGKTNYKSFLSDFLNAYETKLKNVLPKKMEKTIEKDVVGLCPKCGDNVIQKITSNNKIINQCSSRKFNSRTKTYSGCDYFKFIENKF